MAGAISSLGHTRSGTAPMATHESLWIRVTLIGITLIFLTLFLFLPMILVFKEALSKGAAVYIAAITEPAAAHAIKLTLFRRDLLYRINIAQIQLPPLRNRPGDVMPLADHFLRTYAQRIGRHSPQFSSAAKELLLNYSWPGNIRELENVVHFALLVASGETIEPEHLKVTGGWATGNDRQSVQAHLVHRLLPQSSDSNIECPTHLCGSHQPAHESDDPMTIIANQLRRLFRAGGNGHRLDDLESLIVREAFTRARSNQVHASALLGISRNVMRTLLKRHGLLADSNERQQADDGQTSHPQAAALSSE